MRFLGAGDLDHSHRHERRLEAEHTSGSPLHLELGDAGNGVGTSTGNSVPRRSPTWTVRVARPLEPTAAGGNWSEDVDESRDVVRADVEERAGSLAKRNSGLGWKMSGPGYCMVCADRARRCHRWRSRGARSVLRAEHGVGRDADQEPGRFSCSRSARPLARSTLIGFSDHTCLPAAMPDWRLRRGQLEW